MSTLTRVRFRVSAAPKVVNCSSVFFGKKPAPLPTSCMHVALVVEVGGETALVECDGRRRVRCYPAKFIVAWRMVNDIELADVAIRRVKASPAMRTALQKRLTRFVDEELPSGMLDVCKPPKHTSTHLPGYFGMPATTSMSLILTLFTQAGLLTAAASRLAQADGWAMPWRNQQQWGCWAPGVVMGRHTAVHTRDDWAPSWDGDGIKASQQYRRTSVCSVVSSVGDADETQTE